jgi:hypothetical protein
VLTAADALQFAWDGAELRTGDEEAGGFSQFTRGWSKAWKRAKLHRMTNRSRLMRSIATCSGAPVPRAPQRRRNALSRATSAIW